METKKKTAGKTAQQIKIAFEKAKTWADANKVIA